MLDLPAASGFMLNGSFEESTEMNLLALNFHVSDPATAGAMPA
jgi:hypothetical protein